MGLRRRYWSLALDQARVTAAEEWCAWQESNLLPFGPEPDELDPFELEHRVLRCDGGEVRV